MKYFKSLKGRLINAFGSMKFWTQGLVVFGLSGLGIWWPLFFEWQGYDNLFFPEPWFTYGVATLMTIISKRLFMEEAEDSYMIANRLILLLLSLGGGLLYGKSVQQYFSFVKSAGLEFDYSLTKYAVGITLLAWLINFIGTNEYDAKDATNALGGALK